MKIRRDDKTAISYFVCESDGEQYIRLAKIANILNKEKLNWNNSWFSYNRRGRNAYNFKENTIFIDLRPSRIKSFAMSMCEKAKTNLFEYFTMNELALLHEFGHSVHLGGEDFKVNENLQRRNRIILNSISGKMAAKFVHSEDAVFQNEHDFRMAFNDLYTMSPLEDVANNIATDVALYLIESGYIDKIWRG